MKKDELVQAVAESADISRTDADRAVKAFVDTIVSNVASGQKIQVPGLGTFDARERSAREGRNPQTGETIQIAATTVPGFKAAAGFKQAVAGE